jgi:alkylation response protein AidB-like acyl-CoA dehydrogenase
LTSVSATDLEELSKLLRTFFTKRSSEDEVRRLMATGKGYDPTVWRQLASQLHLQGLAIPEEFGGSGYGFTELAVVFEEMGRALLCAPYLSTAVLAASVLLLSGDLAAQQQWLPMISSGTMTATVAVTDIAPPWTPDGLACQARRFGDGWLIDGAKNFVLDGATADLVLVVTDGHVGTSLYALDGNAAGVTRVPLSVVDQTRKLARIEFHGAEAQLIGNLGEGAPVVAAALDRASVALAAEQLGGARKVFSDCIQHAKTRQQFGRPIGSFQAIKHRCVDLLLDLECAQSAVWRATAAIDNNEPESHALASLAAAVCSDAYSKVAAENIQIHGGIGFTWEHSAHLYFKRAQLSRHLFGSPEHHREQFACGIGL